MTAKNHPLFKRYPLNGDAEISTGTVPTPYQTYDGKGLFIGGSVAPDVVKELLRDEQVHPLQSKSGRAVAGIWVVDWPRT